ncbi:MAG: NDP-sugar synthase [Deltaproteobacteria bacterium]|nr:NDP-sugar synthase [Deltaproteobacteria bacterium]
MKALVLAAGYGERLRPLTDTIPKPLLEIGGRPLIHYPLLLLRHAGIREVSVNVHHLADKIEAALGRGDELGLSITYSPEPILLGTGGCLLPLRGYFSGEPFLILNGDTIMDLDLPTMIAIHRKCRGSATMALRQTASPEAYSQIQVDADGRIRRMRLLVERARREFENYPDVPSAELATDLRTLMYCGAMICAPAVFDMMPATPPFSLIGNVLAPMITEHLPLYGHVHEGFFRTVDDLEAYRQLHAEFIASPPGLRYISRL